MEKSYMEHQKTMIELLSSPDGMTVDTTSSPETQQRRVQLIMSLYLAGYDLEYSVYHTDKEWTRLTFFPLNFTRFYRLSSPIQIQNILDTLNRTHTL